MKNIFKMMGVALMACSLMVACGPKDPEENNDTTPVDPPAPSYSVTINWDGVDQALGFKDAYQSTQQQGKLFWFEGAKGMNGNNYEFPAFIIPFYNGTVGMLPACLYQFLVPNADNGYDTIDGNNFFPLEVFNESGIEITEEGQTYTIGDYQYYQHNYSAQPEVTFDATALTLSINVPVTMFDYAAAANGQHIHKVLDATFVNYPFEAAN